MKTKKITSVFLSLVIVFTLAFANTSLAAKKSKDSMYYANNSTIYKLDLNTKKSTVIKSFSEDAFVYNLIVKDNWIYFNINTLDSSNTPVMYICRVETNGKNYKNLCKNALNPVVHGGKIYYIKLNETNNDYQTDGIYKMDLDGNKKELVKTFHYLDEFIIYKNRIYYVYNYTKDGYNYKSYFRSMKLDTSKLITHVSESEDYISSLKAMKGNIYYTQGENIAKLNIRENDSSQYLKNSTILAVADNFIYYRAYKDDILYKKDLDSEVILIDDYFVSKVYVYKDNMLVQAADAVDINIMYCDINGKNRKIIDTVGIY